MADLAGEIRALRFDLERRAGGREVVRTALAKIEGDATAQVDRADVARKAGEVIQAAIEARRLELRERVETLVTRGLRSVFGRADLEFYFDPVTRGGIVGILPALRSEFRGQQIDTGITEGHGGGIADAIAFLLRVIVLSLERPKLAPVLVLDEPFRHVSLEYLRGCASLLKELNRSAGIQFVLVTHKPDLLDAADVVYRATIANGETKFELEHDLRDDVFHQRAAAWATKREKRTEDEKPIELAPPGTGEPALPERDPWVPGRERKIVKARARKRGTEDDVDELDL